MANNDMEKPIKSFGFDANNPIDREVVSKANQYCALKKGIPALSSIRNLLLEAFDRAIENERSQQRQPA